MKMTMTRQELIDLVSRQLGSMFVFDAEVDGGQLSQGVARALERAVYCFSFNTCRYYHEEGQVLFNPFQSSQYTTFLYYLSNTLWIEQDNRSLADRVYYLNKALNSVELFYESDLPAVFNVDHPLGTVMGRAKYSNYLCIAQYCTVGNSKGVYPSFGENIVLYPGSTVIGRVRVGNNCAFAAGCWVKDEDIPDNSLVFGRSPNLTIKTMPTSYFWENPGKWKTQGRP